MKHIVCRNNICIENNQGWFVDEIYNQIFQIDLLTNKVNYVDCFMGIRFKKDSYQIVKKYGNDLFIVPYRSQGNIIVYNLKEKKYDEINLDIDSGISRTVVEIWETNDSFIAYCWNPHKIVEFDKINRGNVKYYNLKYNALSFKHLKKSKNNSHFICLGCCDECEIIEIDYVKAIIESHIIDKDIWGIVDMNDLLWINKGSVLMIYDRTIKEVIECINMSDYFIKDNEHAYMMEIRDSENFVWYIPCFFDYLIYVNKKNKKINTIMNNAQELSKGYQINCVYNKRYLYLYSYKEEKNLIIDMETATIINVKFKISDEEYHIMSNQKYRANEIIYECDYMKFKDVFESESFFNIEHNQTRLRTVGSNIYNVSKK